MDEDGNAEVFFLTGKDESGDQPLTWAQLLIPSSQVLSGIQPLRMPTGWDRLVHCRLVC